MRVQDPRTLLARLNTRRLRRRRLVVATDRSSFDDGRSRDDDTARIAAREWEEERARSSSSEDDPRGPPPPSPELLRFARADDDDGCFPPGETTLLASYPRCGNTLLRSLFERVTGTVTGCDTRPDRTLSLALALKHGMVGEGLVAPPTSRRDDDDDDDDTGVRLVKTHFPERRGRIAFDAHRVVLLTRNPYDAMESYLHMALTNTHTSTLSDETLLRFDDTWRDLVRNEIVTWRDFHLYWLDGERVRVPTLVVRYEDLVRAPKEIMRRVLAFSMNRPLSSTNDDDDDACDLGPFWESRLDRVLGADDEAGSVDGLGSYAPRRGRRANNDEKGATSSPTTTADDLVGRSLVEGRYTDDMLDHVDRIAGPMLRAFGYDALHQGFPRKHRARPLPERRRVLLNVRSTTDDVGPPPAVRVNVGKEVRDPNSIYGRYMTTFRKQFTNNDANPLPTV